MDKDKIAQLIIKGTGHMCYIGIDFGGTNIAVGVVTQKGEIIASDSTPTLAGRDYTEIVADMAMVSKRVVEKANITMADIKAIGIGSPGLIDNKNGVVLNSNKLKFKHAPIAEELKKHLGLPVHVENDANAAAYGEYAINGKGTEDFVFVTLGTGVGGGIILNGKLYTGFNKFGGEIGHMTLVHGGIECGCGNSGCWENYASVTALINQTKEAIEKNSDSLMAKYAIERGKVDGRTAFDAAKAGDEPASAVVKQYLEYVASGIVSIINIFQPKKVLIGGGISKEGDYLLKPIQEYCRKHEYNKEDPHTEIGLATLFNDAGIIGAALIARQ